MNTPFSHVLHKNGGHTPRTAGRMRFHQRPGQDAAVGAAEQLLRGRLKASSGGESGERRGAQPPA